MRRVLLACSCTTCVVRDGIVNVFLGVLVGVAVLIVDIVLSGVLLPVGTLFVLLRLAHSELVLSALLDYLLYLGDLLETVQWREVVMWISLTLV